ncbi:MAG: hypothetical protein KC503_35510 [Myxococcales bacterium]|nr:hypothetical protein [Myxococcales bacterium]
MSGDASQQLQRLLGAVVARLAHDLKNPLAVVLSNVRFLEEEVTPDSDAAEALAETEQSAELLRAMLDDAVDSLRIGAGTYRVESRPLDLGEIEPALAERLSGRLGSRKLRVEMPERTIDTDAKLVKRALCALLEHAVRQSPPGDEISVVGRIVTRDGSEVLEIEVIDGGQPFDPNRPPTFVVQDFSGRTPSPDHRSDRGLGLGFAGAALRAAGAEVDVTAREDGEEGARFLIALPLAGSVSSGDGA